MAPRGKQINVARDIRSLATDDYLFNEGRYAVVVHQHKAGDHPHYRHGEDKDVWGHGWRYQIMIGDVHFHEAEIKNNTGEPLKFNVGDHVWVRSLRTEDDQWPGVISALRPNDKGYNVTDRDAVIYFIDEHMLRPRT